ncbi:MAG: T9SS type A sorting domain-containing protein [Bacteroidia bacterium]
MLKIFRKGFFPLIAALTGAFQLSVAQSVIVLANDSLARSPFAMSPSGQRGGSPDTLSIGPNTPFFDDFSYPGLFPDSAHWFMAPNDLTTPVISRNQAVNPPSRGVATFDGSNKYGEAYNPANIGSGITDRLLSHYIDLAPWTVSSQAKLSFFLQPAGLGEKPEATDSFYVYFRTPLPPPNDFKKVLAIGGTPSKPFRQYVIPLNDPLFFHTGFQILFQTLGSQNGMLDVWHLDYVLLGLNRNSNDTTYNDRSPVNLSRSILHPFSAIPITHYLAGSGSNMQPFTVNIDNLAGQNQNATLSAKLSDPVGGSVFSATQNQTASLPPYAVNPVNFPAFADQALNGIAAYKLEVSTPATGDIRPENNVLEEIFRIDSVFAYDDGEADASFGLNQGLGFGMKFTLSQPDSLAAVWISFVPTVNYNQVTGKATYMKDKSFRLAVWKDSHPDSLILQQIGGMKVTYGNTPNHFQRFPLSTPLQVPQTFWVGVQQTDTEPLGVGFDFNYDNDAYTFWDSLGHWVNTRMGGCLMIRAEMYNTTALATSIEKSVSPPLVNLFPNPVTGNTVEINLENIEPGTLYHAEIMDIQGRILQSFPAEKINNPALRLNLYENIPAGMVIWKHYFQMPNGDKKYFTEKLLILR